MWSEVAFVFKTGHSKIIMVHFQCVWTGRHEALERKTCCHLAWSNLTHPSLESNDEDTNGGGRVHRSTNKQEEKMTKGIPKAQEGISAIWHCLPSRVLGLSKGICVVNSLKQRWPIPVNGPTPLLGYCTEKWRLTATRRVGCWMLCLVENDSGPTCLRGNPKVPATTTIRHRVLYQYNNWVATKFFNLDMKHQEWCLQKGSFKHYGF